jgi:hypothetical protein
MPQHDGAADPQAEARQAFPALLDALDDTVAQPGRRAPWSVRTLGTFGSRGGDRCGESARPDRLSGRPACRGDTFALLGLHVPGRPWMKVRDPEKISDYLSRQGGGLPAAGASAEDAILASITASYFYLRRGIAFVSLAFPFALFALAGFQSSLSAYYHCSRGGCALGAGAARDVLTGVLLVTATFLYFYKGYTRREDWALNLAGIAAAAVAFFPCDFRVDGGGEGRSLFGKIHFTSGLVFFLAIAFVCLFCSGETLAKLKDAAKARQFRRAYAGLGTAMIALPLAVLALHFLLDRGREGYFVYGLEVAALFVFAAFWLVKSREIALIERQADR